MTNVYEKLQELGLTLPKAPAKGGVYRPAVCFSDKLVYISGCGPVIDQSYAGVFGREYTKEEGPDIARKAMLNVLAVLEQEIGDLNLVKQPVKITTFVASDAGFYDQPYVANGGSLLLAQLYGAQLVPSRSALGLIVLPGNIPVETEALFELK